MLSSSRAVSAKCTEIYFFKTLSAKFYFISFSWIYCFILQVLLSGIGTWGTSKDGAVFKTTPSVVASTPHNALKHP